MIETKLFELRDHSTFIPIIASRMTSDDPHEAWLLRRAGYRWEGEGAPPPLVLLTRVQGNYRAQYDPYSWTGRTYPVAHDHIARNWHELQSGAVVDVRFILGETPAPCESECSAVELLLATR